MSSWTVHQRDGVTNLRFTRPPNNYMDFRSLTELSDLLEHVGGEPETTHVVMLSSGVDDIFINHAELSDLTRAGSGQATPADTGSWTRALNLLEHIPQPTIAAIDGLASGGGHEIALACTLRVASERARLQQPEVPIGIVPGGGGSVRLPRLVGAGVAAEAILTGRPVEANEALRTGWVNAVFSTDGFIESAWDWAVTIAASPTPALSAAKKIIIDGSRVPFDAALKLEREQFYLLAARFRP